MGVSPQPVPRAPDQASEIVDSEAGERAYHGTLKWFDVTRGFGFVVADEPGVGDILIHFTVLQPHGRRSLPEGARVEDRKSVGYGTSVSVRVALGGRRIIKKQTTTFISISLMYMNM